jgi:ABC-type Fe3+-hydroxamate transport system substrate-binding protein
VSTSDNTRPEPFPRRIVSLVPSLTELLASWGLGERLAGRTRYCEEPRELMSRVETVGGTKNPDVSRIVELRPDLVVVNREENRREDYEALIAAGLAVHVTHPRTVAEAADMFRALGAVVGASEAAEALAARSRAALAAAEASRPERPVPTFCPIWRNPWMTFSERTYIGDMLTVAGLANVFGGADSPDFFDVDLGEARRRAPTLVLLPDEPYVFEEKHVKELTDFGFRGRFELVSGKDLSWYGPRMPDAVTRLVAFAGKVAAASAVV